jgi:hypothetical protein
MALNKFSDMTQVVLYMSRNMLIPSQPERAAAKSSEAKNQHRGTKTRNPRLGRVELVPDFISGERSRSMSQFALAATPVGHESPFLRTL